LATLGSPLSVCIPPAACHVEPAVSSRRSSSITSVQPAFVRWYSTLAPTTPPPMTTTCVCCFPRSPRKLLVTIGSIVCRDAALGDAPLDERVELLTVSGVHARRCVAGGDSTPEPVRLRRQLW